MDSERCLITASVTGSRKNPLQFPRLMNSHFCLTKYFILLTGWHWFSSDIECTTMWRSTTAPLAPPTALWYLSHRWELCRRGIAKLTNKFCWGNLFFPNRLCCQQRMEGKSKPLYEQKCLRSSWKRYCHTVQKCTTSILFPLMYFCFLGLTELFLCCLMTWLAHCAADCKAILG